MKNSKKIKEFDAAKLFARKKQFGGYNFCPFCAAELEKENLDGHDRLTCSNADCDFVHYHNPVPAAGAIVIKDSKILLVKRAHPPRLDRWCIPAGFMEWNEHPRDTATREVKEETGLIIKLNSLFNLYSGDDDPRTNAILVLYLAEEIGGNLQASDDASEVHYFAADEMPEELAFASHNQAISDYLSSR